MILAMMLASMRQGGGEDQGGWVESGDDEETTDGDSETDSETFSSDGAGSDSDGEGDVGLISHRLSSCTIDLSRIHHVSGPMHIIHNVTDDPSKVLLWWDAYAEQLTHVCRLLTKPWSREKFFETCLTPDEQAWVMRNVSFEALKVNQIRRGSIASATRDIQKVQRLLQDNWSLQKYNFNDNADAMRAASDRARGDDTGADGIIADKAVCDCAKPPKPRTGHRLTC